jgi:hypothetical protein
VLAEKILRYAAAISQKDETALIERPQASSPPDSAVLGEAVVAAGSSRLFLRDDGN